MKVNLDWNSRKWWLVLASILYTAVVHIWPSVAEKMPPEVVQRLLYIILGWLGVQGVADIMKVRNEGKAKEIAANAEAYMAANQTPPEQPHWDVVIRMEKQLKKLVSANKKEKKQ